MAALSSGFSRHTQLVESTFPQSLLETLLVVDDEEGITSSIAEIFRGRYQVITAFSAEEALTKLETENVAVVISDQRMPRMSGAELLSRIAVTQPEATRIMLTGYADLEAVVKAVNDGQIYFYMTKPWKSGEMEAVVEHAFERHALLQKNRELIEQLRQANAELEDKVEQRTQELREKNSALEASNKIKNEFLGIAAHDLRSPLGSIRSMAELLLDEKDQMERAEAREFLGMIQSTSNQMLTLVNDLLDISRIEAGKIELKLETVELRPYLAEIEKYNQMLGRRKRIQLEVNCEEDVVEGRFDPERIRQVLNNLLGNAFKFSPPETTVTLAVRFGGDLEFSVTDQGLGIRSEELPLLFGAFHRTSTRPTGDEQSSGLGLSICKQIVEAHGGTIGVESSHGQGSRFHFRLPALPQPDETHPGGIEQ
ncbi:MAG TPA: hybrid sensor histidine kinase/response regulator [Pyrinomonadaceae bacterium]|nr:hybrid sensor histidine kinase/response regulator [Pyrinomonadaceae bacterium]